MNIYFSQNGLRCSGGLSDPPRGSADMDVGEMTDGLAMEGVGVGCMGGQHGGHGADGRQRALHAQLAGAPPVAAAGGPCGPGFAHVALAFARSGGGTGAGAAAGQLALG